MAVANYLILATLDKIGAMAAGQGMFEALVISGAVMIGAAFAAGFTLGNYLAFREQVDDDVGGVRQCGEYVRMSYRNA